MSIVGVVALGVLLEIMIGEGETSKYIKGIFSLAVVLIIITPLPKFLMSDFDFDKIFNSDKYDYDNVFVEKTALERNQIREDKLKKLLIDNNIQTERVKVYFIGEDFNKIDIVKVYVINVSQSDTIKELVSKYLKIDKEVINVYERE